MRSKSYPCLCLCLGFSHITRNTPLLRTTAHFSHKGPILACIFKRFLLLAPMLLPQSESETSSIAGLGFFSRSLDRAG